MIVATNAGPYAIFQRGNHFEVCRPDRSVAHRTDSQLDAEIFCWFDGTVNTIGVENWLRRR